MNDDLDEFTKQRVIEELYNVGNCAVDCGSTEIIDYVDFRLGQLNSSEGVKRHVQP